ncbi:MAG: class I SAM-dependent methyltransferase [Terracidiphilus sp.]|jgi:SAM-dependent methyltransferase
MRTGQDPYDSVAYPSFPYPDTHPDRLAAMAILHGLSPAPVEQCRVLEIGCNEGANLIPMAYAVPRSEFVGFDLAGLPIARGQERIRGLGLRNVRLFESNLLDAGAELGQFDYVIAHGLYAWVPEPVRERLLALCAELLTPDGVAFVSYNALPGGHLRKMIREMMLFQVKGIEDPEQRVSGGLAFLHFLAEARPEGDAYRLLIEDQLKRMEKRSPQVTYHDELGGTYHPVRFIEFVGHARRHGLQYLSEAVLPPPTDPCYRSDMRSALASAAGDDILKQEQMLDFARMRGYRETLLCRAERLVRRDFPAEHLRRLLLASPVKSTPGETSGAKVFRLSDGIKMESNHAGAIALLEGLEAAWPRALSFGEIEPRIAGSGFTLDGDGVTLLMRLVVAKMVELHAWRAPVAGEVSARPRASACARQEARTRPYATTLLHSTVTLDDPVVRNFLRMLDGTHERGELLDAMKADFPALPQEALEEGIEPGLAFFHRAGLLEG